MYIVRHKRHKILCADNNQIVAEIYSAEPQRFVSG